MRENDGLRCLQVGWAHSIGHVGSSSLAPVIGNQPSKLRVRHTTDNKHGSFAKSTMRWPWTGDEDDKKSGLASWTGTRETANWSSTFAEPRTLIPAIVLTATTVAGLRLYKSYLRRIPSVNHIKPGYFRRRSLFGRVTTVGDADNFRLFHTPGGRLVGWGWLPWKKVPTTREGLLRKTVRWPYPEYIFILGS